MNKYLLSILSLLLLTTASSAQWKKLGAPAGGRIVDLVQCWDRLYAGTSSGIYESADTGKSWQKLAITNGPIKAMSGGPFLAYSINDECGTYIYISQDTVKTSSKIGASLDPWPFDSWPSPHLLYNSGDILFTATLFTKPSIFINGDTTFSEITNPPNTNSADSYLFSGSKTICGYAGLSISSDTGKTWTEITTWPNNARALLLFNLNNTIFAATADSGVYSSNDTGTTWQKTNELNSSMRVYDFCTLEENLLAATSKGLFISSDSGTSFNSLDTTLIITDIESMGSVLIAATENDGLIISQDTGKTWAPSENGPVETNFSVTYIQAVGKTLIVVSPYTKYSGKSRWFISFDNGKNWDHFSFADSIKTTPRYYTTINDTFYIGFPDVIYASADSGHSWFTWSDSLPAQNLFGLGKSNDAFYLRNTSSIYKRSKDNNTWSPLALPIDTIRSFYSCDSILFLGSLTQLFFSKNSGNTWQELTENLPAYLKSDLPGTFYTTIFNDSWVLFFNPEYWVFADCYISDNQGLTWKESNIKHTHITTSTHFRGYESTDNALFVAELWWEESSTASTISVLQKGSPGWVDITTTSIEELEVYSLAHNRNSLFVGTLDAGIWKYDLSNLPEVAILTDNTPENALLPLRIISTTKGFTLKYTPQNMKISQPEISVFDIAGKKIKTNIRKVQGVWEITIPNIAPGMYVYQISDIDYVRNGRYVFMK